MNKTYLSLIACCLLVFISSPVLATSYTILDNYVGGNSANSNNKATNEVIGDDKYWAVSKMDIQITNSSLTVDVHSQFLNNIGYHNVYMGDLFISVNGWHPSGDAPYDTDISANGEKWEYALSLDYNRYTDYQNTSGTTTLYAIGDNQPGRIELTETQPVDKRADYYRTGQEIYYVANGQTGLGNGTWDIMNLGGEDTDDYLRFIINNDFLFGIDHANLAFRWQMTCANDTIEGQIAPVPEPATMLLFSTGLAGLAGIRRKKKA